MISAELTLSTLASKMAATALSLNTELTRSCSMRSVRRKRKKGIVRKRSDSKYPMSNYCNDCREWFLTNIPMFKSLPEEILTRISDIMIEKHYSAGEVIKYQDTNFSNVFIIAKGYAAMSKLKDKDASPMTDDLIDPDDEEEDEEFIGYLSRGDWFGDIFDKECRMASFTTTAIGDDGVECLILEKDAYHQLIMDPSEDIPREKLGSTAIIRLQLFEHLNLRDLVVLGSLGSGAFGRVELIRIHNDDSKTFALKQLSKTRIVQEKQQDHVMHERNILLQVDSDFIVRLYRTFKDRKYLYMMMEVCLGGELWSILREKSRFDDFTTKFYAGCVIAALGYLHSRNIIYRDLKPENLLLDHRGYCKLTDFGFAKRIGVGRKTWTFCGTPDYVAPEIILYTGHDVAADYWSLGILIFELLSGRPPFIASTNTKTYDLIIAGIDSVEFPKCISKDAQNLIKKLCRSNPSERLGYGNVGMVKCFKHPWFCGISQDELFNQTMIPPIIPEIRSQTDRANFGYVKPDMIDVPDDDVTGWDRDF